MPYGADTLRTLLKVNLHNDSALTDPTDYNMYLTLGQNRIVRDCPEALGVKKGSATLATDSRLVYLATDFFQMVSVHIPSENRWLDYLGMQVWSEEIEASSDIPTGVPYQYSIYSNLAAATPTWYMVLNRTPADTYTLYYWYYWIPAAISGTTVPPHSAIGFENLIVWAATMVAREPRDQAGYQTAVQHYERELAALRAHSPAKPGWKPAMNRLRRGDGGGSTLRLPDTFGDTTGSELILPE